MSNHAQPDQAPPSEASTLPVAEATSQRVTVPAMPWPLSFQLGVVSPGETINLPIEDDLDPEGWDVRKAARLLAKSNGSLIEWLHSPITYRVDEVFLSDWRTACLLP